MGVIKQLSREDVMFVAGETDTIYQHVGGLSILDTSDDADFSFEHFRQHCIERTSLIPHFRWKLHMVPMGMDRPYWVEDEHFNFDHHIKRIALPKPGDKKTLCEIAAHLYCKHLDRDKPLWEIWLIEGLQGGKFAYLQKFHHCMMDGEGAFKMIEIICDFEADPTTEKQVDQSISDAKAGPVPTYQQRSSKAWQHWSRLPGEAARSMYDILRPKLLEQFVWPKKPREERPEVPTACFNGEISSERATTFTSLSLASLKAVKNHFEVSLNEVVLAVVSGAMRRYLLDHDALPELPLRSNIPVSLRDNDDAKLSNKVTNTTVTLATHLEHPLERLREINRESEEAKAQVHNGTTGVVEMFQMMPPILISTIMESLPAEQAPQILGANLIVSNVRGSPLPLYIAGAKLEKMFPMSILTAGIGINVTCVSYIDEMDFGIIVDPDLAPALHTLPDHIEAALNDYLDLLPKPKPKSRPKAKSKTTTRAKAKAKAKAKVKKSTQKTPPGSRKKASARKTDQ